MKASDWRDWIVSRAKSLFEHGYTAGGLGNISAKLTDGVLLPPDQFVSGQAAFDKVGRTDKPWKR
jgi:ribulose-5-phosphate 4-epimerase/fuculose-1-phosphate aldolase